MPNRPIRGGESWITVQIEKSTFKLHVVYRVVVVVVRGALFVVTTLAAAQNALHCQGIAVGDEGSKLKY